ncbi:21725_t:CDS:2 [Entrophospora sp. SA101]|nr:13389_t:CDS:2 [Entrophospora sp. SA101]CAJ0768780.1 21725_t:CDS:2 [Entrophospora sp. SA101]
MNNNYILQNFRSIHVHHLVKDTNKCKTTQQSNIGTDLSTSLFFKRKIKTRGLFKGVSIYTTGILGDILAHFSTYDASREHVNKGNAKGIGLSCLEDRSQTTINAFLGTSSDVINSSLWYQLMLYHDNFKFLRHLRHRRLVIPGGELSSLNYNNNNNTCIDIIYQNSIN